MKAGKSVDRCYRLFAVAQGIVNVGRPTFSSAFCMRSTTSAPHLNVVYYTCSFTDDYITATLISRRWCIVPASSTSELYCRKFRDMPVGKN